jgi:hypothetical protein
MVQVEVVMKMLDPDFKDIAWLLLKLSCGVCAIIPLQ